MGKCIEAGKQGCRYKLCTRYLLGLQPMLDWLRQFSTWPIIGLFEDGHWVRSRGLFFYTSDKGGEILDWYHLKKISIGWWLIGDSKQADCRQGRLPGHEPIFTNEHSFCAYKWHVGCELLLLSGWTAIPGSGPWSLPLLNRLAYRGRLLGLVKLRMLIRCFGALYLTQLAIFSLEVDAPVVNALWSSHIFICLEVNSFPG